MKKLKFLLVILCNKKGGYIYWEEKRESGRGFTFIIYIMSETFHFVWKLFTNSNLLWNSFLIYCAFVGDPI